MKPSGKAWTDLVCGDWWTTSEGKTGKAGEYSTRGFLGDYEITVTANGKTKTVKSTLPTDGATMTVKLR